MPELPEVETVVRGLRSRLEGKRIRRLQVMQPLIVRGSLRRFRRVLRGARIARLSRRGKYILLELRPVSSRGRRYYWIVHLGMTGQLYACAPRTPLLKHTHVVAGLSSGEQLRFRDQRRFGKMLLLPEANLADYFAALGPEPFRLRFQRFCTLFAGRRAPVKNLLLNQNRLRGLGNIYSSEALFVAGIHPARAAETLTRSELRRLFRALHRVLREAIAGQGSSVSDYRTADGLPGDYQNYLRVYDQEGEPCPRCGTAIKRVVLAGRSAHFCPRCQPDSDSMAKAGARRA
ncbi:MAG: bifunctional DNA-formamidopyrimidine glycosylase/DNA-(apurinic or apyrimidinic site) lyase [Terriglobia bacterium]